MATQTTQATGKLWKACRALGGLAAVLAVCWLGVALFGGYVDGSHTAPTTVAWREWHISRSVGVFFVSLCAYVSGRVGAWWFHA